MDKLAAEAKIKKRLSEVSFIKDISDIAGKLNYKVYAVGGFVRDVLLEREKKEIDFLVIGGGVEFAEKLSAEMGARNLTVFRNFGTAHFKYQDFDLEFVGARKESYDRTSRKPVVEDGAFEDDIRRRDFTVNAMAVSINKEDYGSLIDTYNGLEDLENKIIRTPLDPLITFSDDPLRIMRAFRFASQLGLNVDDKIKGAAKEMAERLEIVSQERITDEFLKILASANPAKGLILLYETGVMRKIFPEVANLAGVEQRKDFHHKDVFFHTCKVVENISKAADDVWLRFAALMHDIAKPPTKKFEEGIGWTFHGHEDLGAKMMPSIFKKLKLPLHKLEYVSNLVRLHLRPMALVDDEVTDSAIRRLIVQAGEDLDDLIKLCRADITSHNPQKVSQYLSNYEKVVQKIIEVKEKDKLREFQSPVRGDEIMKICNIPPSKKVGLLKNAIEEAILDGKIGNNYEEAYEYLLSIKDGYI